MVVDISEEILQRAKADVLKNIRVVPLFSKTLPRIAKEEADGANGPDDRSLGSLHPATSSSRTSPRTGRSRSGSTRIWSA